MLFTKRCPGGKSSGLPLPVRIKSENGDLTTCARAQPFQNLDRCRLARAVRSQQAKHFPRPDFKVDSLHRLHIAVRLPKPLHGYRRRSRNRSRSHREQTGYWRSK
jgi:hypothetical protein